MVQGQPIFCPCCLSFNAWFTVHDASRRCSVVCRPGAILVEPDASEVGVARLTSRMTHIGSVCVFGRQYICDTYVVHNK